MPQENNNDNNQASQPDETPLEQMANDNSDNGRGWMFYAVAGIVGSIVACLLLFVVAIAVGILSRDTGAMADFVAVSRDLLVILLILQGIVIGVGLLAIIYQVARLLNILQNEIDPIVEGTRETVATAQGTAEFISRHLTEPIIKGQSMVRGASEFAQEASGVKDIMDLYTRKNLEEDPTPDIDAAEMNEMDND